MTNENKRAILYMSSLKQKKTKDIFQEQSLKGVLL